MSRGEALSRVREWMAADNEAGAMGHGFKEIDRDKRPYLAGKGPRGVSHAMLARMSKDAARVRVPVSELVATQEWVSLQGVALYLDTPDAKPEGATAKTGLLIDLPIAVRLDEVIYLHDGHHRATATRLAGEEDLEVRVIDLDAMAIDAWAASRG